VNILSKRAIVVDYYRVSEKKKIHLETSTGNPQYTNQEFTELFSEAITYQWIL
jgi:hypothetical protein